MEIKQIEADRVAGEPIFGTRKANVHMVIRNIWNQIRVPVTDKKYNTSKEIGVRHFRNAQNKFEDRYFKLNELQEQWKFNSLIRLQKLKESVHTSDITTSPSALEDRIKDNPVNSLVRLRSNLPNNSNKITSWGHEEIVPLFPSLYADFETKKQKLLTVADKSQMGALGAVCPYNLNSHALRRGEEVDNRINKSIPMETGYYERMNGGQDHNGIARKIAALGRDNLTPPNKYSNFGLSNISRAVSDQAKNLFSGPADFAMRQDIANYRDKNRDVVSGSPGLVSHEKLKMFIGSSDIIQPRNTRISNQVRGIDNSRLPAYLPRGSDKEGGHHWTASDWAYHHGRANILDSEDKNSEFDSSKMDTRAFDTTTRNPNLEIPLSEFSSEPMSKQRISYARVRDDGVSGRGVGGSKKLEKIFGGAQARKMDPNYIQSLLKAIMSELSTSPNSIRDSVQSGSGNARDENLAAPLGTRDSPLYVRVLDSKTSGAVRLPVGPLMALPSQARPFSGGTQVAL